MLMPDIPRAPEFIQVEIELVSELVLFIFVAEIADENGKHLTIWFNKV